jgi:hypothetical protein
LNGSHCAAPHENRNQTAPKNSWQVFEAARRGACIFDKEQAIAYAESRASFRAGEIRIFNSSGVVARIFPFNGTDRKF